MIYLLKYFNLKAKQQNATNDTERDQAVLAISPDTWSNNLYKNKQFFIDARDGELFRDYNYGIPNLKLYLDTSKDKSFFNYYVTHGFDWNQFNDYGEAARTFKDKVMYMNTRSSGELNIFKDLLDTFNSQLKLIKSYNINFETKIHYFMFNNIGKFKQFRDNGQDDGNPIFQEYNIKNRNHSKGGSSFFTAQPLTDFKHALNYGMMKHSNGTSDPDILVDLQKKDNNVFIYYYGINEGNLQEYWYSNKYFYYFLNNFNDLVYNKFINKTNDMLMIGCNNGEHRSVSMLTYYLTNNLLKFPLDNNDYLINFTLETNNDFKSLLSTIDYSTIIKLQSKYNNRINYNLNWCNMFSDVHNKLRTARYSIEDKRNYKYLFDYNYFLLGVKDYLNADSEIHKFTVMISKLRLIEKLCKKEDKNSLKIQNFLVELNNFINAEEELRRILDEYRIKNSEPEGAPYPLPLSYDKIIIHAGDIRTITHICEYFPIFLFTCADGIFRATYINVGIRFNPIKYYKKKNIDINDTKEHLKFTNINNDYIESIYRDDEYMKPELIYIDTNGNENKYQSLFSNFNNISLLTTELNELYHNQNFMNNFPMTVKARTVIAALKRPTDFRKKLIDYMKSDELINYYADKITKLVLPDENKLLPMPPFLNPPAYDPGFVPSSGQAFLSSSAVAAKLPPAYAPGHEPPVPAPEFQSPVPDPGYKPPAYAPIHELHTPSIDINNIYIQIRDRVNGTIKLTEVYPTLKQYNVTLNEVEQYLNRTELQTELLTKFNTRENPQKELIKYYVDKIISLLVSTTVEHDIFKWTTAASPAETAEERAEREGMEAAIAQVAQVAETETEAAAIAAEAAAIAAAVEETTKRAEAKRRAPVRGGSNIAIFDLDETLAAHIAIPTSEIIQYQIEDSSEEKLGDYLGNTGLTTKQIKSDATRTLIVNNILKNYNCIILNDLKYNVEFLSYIKVFDFIESEVKEKILDRYYLYPFKINENIETLRRLNTENNLEASLLQQLIYMFTYKSDLKNYKEGGGYHYTTKESLESLKYLYEKKVDLFIVSSGGHIDRFEFLNKYLNKYLKLDESVTNLEIKFPLKKQGGTEDQINDILTYNYSSIFKNVYLNFNFFLTNPDLLYSLAPVKRPNLISSLNNTYYEPKVVHNKGIIILEILKKYYKDKIINKLLFIDEDKDIVNKESAGHAMVVDNLYKKLKCHYTYYVLLKYSNIHYIKYRLNYLDSIQDYIEKLTPYNKELDLKFQNPDQLKLIYNLLVIMIESRPLIDSSSNSTYTVTNRNTQPSDDEYVRYLNFLVGPGELILIKEFFGE